MRAYLKENPYIIGAIDAQLRNVAVSMRRASANDGAGEEVCS
ncbi:MAG: hypothetical protein BMS9Abin15_0731 [Gammaproteobacteria bacterium]|nr:MAG: hypothetical protein BMS9Abin15_0731 [Gammaproteobacteria bacterium]